MATSVTFNFEDIFNGDDFDGHVFTILENGLPVDMVGATVNIDLKLAKDSSTYVKRFSTSSSPAEITIPASPAGSFSFLPQKITVATPRKYFHDIEIIFADGRKKTWITGKWNIKQESS